MTILFSPPHFNDIIPPPFFNAFSSFILIIGSCSFLNDPLNFISISVPSFNLLFKGIPNLS